MNAKQADVLVRDHFDEISDSLARGDTWLEIATRFEVDCKRQSVDTLVSRYHEELNRRCSPWRIVAMWWVLDNVDEIARLRSRGFDWAAIIGLVPPVPPIESLPLPHEILNAEHLEFFIVEYNDMIDRGIVAVPDRYPRKAPVSDEELLMRWIVRRQVRIFSTAEAARCNGRRFARVGRVEATLGKLVEHSQIRPLPPAQSKAGHLGPSQWEVLGEMDA
ncbi:hypothetical protein [Ferrimicrobium sp.]|jgi:hypothetical protein|uniref:hypothetical protein n=1 Tax=Ferrimicrobium sp. TaxID=2926050 RepID=UPI00260632E2|nr:hypothetical protein [Ferrimicrobium sp.]